MENALNMIFGRLKLDFPDVVRHRSPFCFNAFSYFVLSSIFQRASSDAVGRSFNRVGKDLLQILVVLIDEEIKRTMRISTKSSNDETESESTKISSYRTNEGDDDLSSGGHGVSNTTRDLVIRKATKIIGHFARVGKATGPLARFPGFLW